MKGVGLAIVWALLLPAAAVSNDGAITGVGGTIEVLDEHPGIVLVGEHVHAQLLRGAGVLEVECFFVLENRGSADTVTIGFPEDSGGDTRPQPFLSFASFVDGSEVACDRIPSGLGPPGSRHWWVKEVFFAPGQTRIIRNLYRAEPGHNAGDPGGDLRFFEYTLGTGASWAGKIGAATVVFSVSPCDSFSVAAASPSPRERASCEVAWFFADFEPGRSGPHFVQVVWHE